MEHSFITTIITIIITLTQYRLSMLKHKAFGAILPILSVLLLIWFIIFKTDKLDFGTFVAFGVLLIFLLGVWAKGRHDLKAKLEKELAKMKAHDLNE